MAPLLHHLASTGFYAAAACTASGAGEGEVVRAVEEGMAGEAGTDTCSGDYRVHGLGVGRCIYMCIYIYIYIYICIHIHTGEYRVHGLGVGRWAAAFEAIGQRLWQWARMPSATAAEAAGVCICATTSDVYVLLLVMYMYYY